MSTATADTTATKDRLALALDVPGLGIAHELTDGLAPYFGTVKVGLQLYTASGPQAVSQLREQYRIFLDLKLHDIPNTVNRAAKEIGHLGVSYFTVHASGGVDMMRAAVEGASEGAQLAGHPAPMALAVTVLTSDTEAPADRLAKLTEDTAAAGVPGIVCAAPDLPTVLGVAPDLFAVTPGIRMPSDSTDDQQRIATPGQALADGASLLVIGRAVTGPDDRAARIEAARAVTADAAGGAS